MAYAKDELRLITGAGGGFGKTWRYETTDTPTVVAAANYISDAQSIGMDVGDIVQVVQFTSTAKSTFSNYVELVVTAVASTGATLGAGGGTATATSGAATLNALQGIITTEALTTAAGAEYTLTLTNSQIGANDFVLATADAATSAGTPGIGGCTVTAGQVVITVTNLHAANAFNAAIKIGFRVFKP
jgi:hypothetical protein